jgi:hypothetical protein
MKKVLAICLIASAAFAAEGYKVLNKIKVGGTGGWDYISLDNNARRLTLHTVAMSEVVDLNPAGGGQITNYGVHGIAVALTSAGFISNGQSNSATVLD